MNAQTTNTALHELWALLLPEVTAPADRQLTLWLMLHDAATVRAGLVQMAAKYRQLNGDMEADYRVRFASSVMNRIARIGASAVPVAN